MNRYSCHNTTQTLSYIYHRINSFWFRIFLSFQMLRKILHSEPTFSQPNNELQAVPKGNQYKYHLVVKFDLSNGELRKLTMKSCSYLESGYTMVLFIELSQQSLIVPFKMYCAFYNIVHFITLL